MYYDGASGIDPDGNGGGIYPRGTANVIYEDGFIWGAIVDGQIRVGGQTYRTGTEPILDRIYRIRTDWRTLTASQVLQDAAEFFRKTVGEVTPDETAQIIEQYEKDWREWPWQDGAPWVDVDGDGVYNPDVDEAGIANADQVVYLKVDDLDEGRATNLYGSPPIGLQLEITAWSYNQPGARLGQIIFKKYKLINISGKQLDSMYVAQWSDPDVGNYTDDLVGSDSVLSLGFAYNGGEVDGEFVKFGLAPAAMGYDFFQGPIVPSPGDTAVFDLKKRPGYKNLGMTSFGYFSAGNEEWSDPDLGVYDGTLQWYNLLRGFITNTNVDYPTPFTHRSDQEYDFTWNDSTYKVKGKPTKFPLNGDPVTGTGDIDGQGFNFDAADRRMSLSSGPFVMAPGDTQEVVVAIIGGLGGGRVQSVADVKITDEIAQKVYDDLFKTIPKPPAVPNVKALVEENEIVLSWGWDRARVKEIEETKFYDSDSTFYSFEGYNVYQLPSATSGLDKAVRIATFDVVNGVGRIEAKRFLSQYGQSVLIPIQFGTDSGIKRAITIDKNYLTGENLFPGNTYYFAVTAYNYNPNPQFADPALESPAVVIPVTTQSPKPGQTSDISVTQIAGKSDGQFLVKVADPEKVTGHKYDIIFKEDTDSNSPTFGEIVWDLQDVNDGKIKLSNQPVGESIDEPTSISPIIDGLQLIVAGPPFAIKTWDYSSGDPSPLYPDYNKGRWFTGGPFGGSALFGGLFIHQNFWGTSTVDPSELVPIKIEWAPMTGFDDWNGNGKYDIGEPYKFDTSKGQKAFMYKTWGPNQYLGYYDVPFKVFDVSDPENPRQLNVFVRDRNKNFQWDLHVDPYEMIRTEEFGGDTVQIDTRYNYVFIMATTYDPDGKIYDPNQGGEDLMATLASNGFTGAIEAYYTMWLSPRGSRPMMAEEGILEWEPYLILQPGDVYEFKAPGIEKTKILAREEVEKVTVYPNPYYAFNPQEPDRFNKFVTFYHLPKKATIRIFDLAGSLVKRLDKNNDDQFFKWDLKNEKGLPVASGIYFAHIEMTLSDGSKVTKVLKIFIIQEAQILEFF